MTFHKCLNNNKKYLNNNKKFLNNNKKYSVMQDDDPLAIK